MHSCWIVALAAALLVPGTAAAQAFMVLPDSRVALTPFVGYRFPFSIEGTRTLTRFDFIETAAFEEDRRGGAALGAELEVRAFGLFSLVGAFAYSRPGRIEQTIETGDALVTVEADGPQIWFAKAGLLLRLPEPAPDRRRYRPAGFLVVAPALVRESYRTSALFEPDPTTPEGSSNAIHHPALNFGAAVVTPLGSPNVALSVGFEDYVTFWDTDALAERDLASTPGLQAEYSYNQSHVFFLRAGLSFRF